MQPALEAARALRLRGRATVPGVRIIEEMKDPRQRHQAIGAAELAMDRKTTVQLLPHQVTRVEVEIAATDEGKDQVPPQATLTEAEAPATGAGRIQAHPRRMEKRLFGQRAGHTPTAAVTAHNIILRAVDPPADGLQVGPARGAWNPTMLPQIGAAHSTPHLADAQLQQTGVKQASER